MIDKGEAPMGPRLAALVLGVLVAGGALGTALAQPPTPDFSFRVHFDQRGELEPASRPVVAAIKAAAPQVTDAFVFSHGWNNDPVTAERTYREFIDGMIAATPTARLPAGFKPLLVGIYWPSALSWMFSSLHTSVGFALVGAVVGEYLGSAAGLGYKIQQAEGVFDVTGVFSGMLILAVVVILVDALVTLVERRLLVWRPGQTTHTAQG